MSLNTPSVSDTRKRLRGLVDRLKQSVVQPIPPELEACEVCGKLDCSQDEWGRCQQRIAVEKFTRKKNERK